MNFPWWIRSELTFSAPPGVGVAEIRSRVVRALEREGATDITITAGQVQFSAERALSRFSPLAVCRSGKIEIKQNTRNILIKYELNIFYLLAWTGLLAAFFAVIGMALLIARSYLALLLLIGFIGLSIPFNYAFYFWKTKVLFKTAALN